MALVLSTGNFLGAGLFLVSFAICLVVPIRWWAAVRRAGGKFWRAFWGIAVSCGALPHVALSVAMSACGDGASDQPVPQPVVLQYDVQIEALRGDTFRVREFFHIPSRDSSAEIAIQRGTFSSAGRGETQVYQRVRDVTGTRRGLFLKQVVIDPLDGDEPAPVSSSLDPNGTGGSSLCTYRCPASTVELTGMKDGRFYKADMSGDLHTRGYGGDERLAWSPYLRDGIQFTYVASPYRKWRAWLEPLLASSSIGTALLILLGSIGGLIGRHIVQPQVENLLAEKTRNVFNRKEGTTTVRLIVSSDGTEKEIEVPDNRR